MQKRRPCGGGAVLPSGEPALCTRHPSDQQAPTRGWNWLSLGGDNGVPARLDTRALNLVAKVELRCPDKPIRPQIASNEAMRRRLASFESLPWWAR